MCKIKFISTLALLLWTIPLVAASTDSSLFSDENIDNIISAGIAVVASVAVSYWTVSRKQFADTITKERLHFIKEWRECAILFCLKLKDGTNNDSEGKSLDYYYYKLLLMCNPTKPDAYIDKEVVELLTSLYSNKLHVEEKDIEKFMALMQANISIEWTGTTLESRKGTLSYGEKENVRLRCYKYYKEYVKSK